MTNDREILEAAAKAIGCVNVDDAKRTGVELVTHETATGPFWMIDGDHSHHWNPLIDDGDALRLAVALIMHINTNPLQAEVMYKNEAGLVKTEWVPVTPVLDKYAATRRAIVRAAATIGGSVP